MTPPTIVNLKWGYHEEANDIYIGLGTPYGNQAANAMSRKKAIEWYEAYWRKQLNGPMRSYYVGLLRELEGKRMRCHCKPKPCHGDVLIKLFEEVWCGRIKS